MRAPEVDEEAAGSDTVTERVHQFTSESRPEIEIYIHRTNGSHLGTNVLTTNGANLARSATRYRRRAQDRRQRLPVSSDERVLMPPRSTILRLSESSTNNRQRLSRPENRRHGTVITSRNQRRRSSEALAVENSDVQGDLMSVDGLENLSELERLESVIGNEANPDNFEQMTDREVLSLNAARTLQTMLEEYHHALSLNEISRGISSRANQEIDPEHVVQEGEFDDDRSTYLLQEGNDSETIHTLRVDLARRLMNRASNGWFSNDAARYLHIITLHPNISSLRARSNSILSGTPEHEELYDTLLFAITEYQRGLAMLAGKEWVSEKKNPNLDDSHNDIYDDRQENLKYFFKRNPFDEYRPQDDLILGRWLTGFELPVRLDLTYWQMVTLSLEAAILVNGMSCGFPEFYQKRNYSERVITNPSSFLASSATFEGFQIVVDRNNIGSFLTSKNKLKHHRNSDHWSVKLQIHRVDYSKMQIFGEMKALYLSKTKKSEEVFLFWTGEILDFEQHNSFLTIDSEGAYEADIAHWTYFEPFQDMSTPEIVECLESRRKLQELNNKYVFMRWKTLCTDLSRKNSDNFASPKGFYYCCMNRSSGSIEGYFYNPSQPSPMQPLLIEYTFPSDSAGKMMPGVKIR